MLESMFTNALSTLLIGIELACAAILGAML